MNDIATVEACLVAGICAAGALVFVAFVILGALMSHAQAAGKADEALGYREPPEVEP
jgi:hypothetical protein